MTRGILAVLVASAWWTVTYAAPYVILANGQRMDGVAIRVRPDGTVVLTRADGQQINLAKGQYKQAVADKPADLDKAAAAVQAGRFDEAIPILQKIMEEYRLLSWDFEAAKLLIRAYTGKQDGAGALKVWDTIMAVYPGLKSDPEACWQYREALLAAGRYTDLLNELKPRVRSDNRREAARALLMRGQVHEVQGNLELAIRDYLRVVLFYERETEILPRALLRVAQALEKNRDSRAKDFFRRLVQEFPDSPEAAAAKGKA